MEESRDPIVDAHEFRRVLGSFATGVVIVSALDQTTPHCMTANAFVSVSLDPPLVLVSVDRRSRMHQILPRAGAYGVSVLARDQEPLSRHFGGRPQDDLEVSFRWEDGLPLIEGAIAHLTCRLVDIHPAGDHTLFIGRVRHLSSSAHQPPLLFHAGRYKMLEVQPLDFDFWW